VDHRTCNSKILYDVEGHILTDKYGKLLNIFRPNIDRAFQDKDVRLFRNSTMKNMCYRYFIRNETQLNQFQEERAWGTIEGPNKAFHVYVDEDVDRNSQEYKEFFRLSREIDALNG
jgi:hypothetical protein